MVLQGLVVLGLTQFEKHWSEQSTVTKHSEWLPGGRDRNHAERRKLRSFQLSSALPWPFLALPQLQVVLQLFRTADSGKPGCITGEKCLQVRVCIHAYTSFIYFIYTCIKLK